MFDIAVSKCLIYMCYQNGRNIYIKMFDLHVCDIKIGDIYIYDAM